MAVSGHRGEHEEDRDYREGKHETGGEFTTMGQRIGKTSAQKLNQAQSACRDQQRDHQRRHHCAVEDAREREMEARRG